MDSWPNVVEVDKLVPNEGRYKGSSMADRPAEMLESRLLYEH